MQSIQIFTRPDAAPGLAQEIPGALANNININAVAGRASA